GKIITNIALIGVGTTVLGVILLIAAILLYSLINVVRENNAR
ncbi:MAG: glycosyltransferase family 2 protein, partial [Nitrososphaeria archaeon]|nr:glycosyltransferase family 2 protein [Nitrososphaeria archaeon]